MVHIESSSDERSRSGGQPPFAVTVQYEDAGIALGAFLQFYCAVQLDGRPLLIDFYLQRACEPSDWMIQSEYANDIKVLF